jgi:heterodisulfide reductase subunit C
MTTVLEYSPDKAVRLADEVMARSGQNLNACYQCRRCAAGCPVSEATGFVTPDRLIRMVLLGKREAALDNLLLWKCVSCFTCGVRCPNDIMTARIVDTLKKMAKEAHVSPATYKPVAFHDSFVKAAKRKGRLNEVEFLTRYAMRSTLSGLVRLKFAEIVQDHKNQAGLGLALLRKGRMHFRIRKIEGKKEFRRLVKKAADRARSVSSSPQSQE